MTSRGSIPPPTVPPGQPLTTAQIAQLAQVSVATVSKVLNGRSEVSKETRALVERVIEQHGFRRQRRPSAPTPLIELVFHELGGDFAVTIIKGVERVARKYDLGVVLSEGEGQESSGRGWVERMLARHPTGVITVSSELVPAQCHRLLARHLPLVLIDPTGEPDHQLPSVGTSNWSGGLSATRHLLSLGHRRIGVITGPASLLASRARLDGYRAALETEGIVIDPTLIREGGFQVADGREHAAELLRAPHRPTAVFACNDAMALGVYQAATAAGLSIPEDLSVVGFDDLVPAQWMIPALTTVRQPFAEMGASAAELMMSLSRGETPPSTRVVLATELVVRASTSSLSPGLSTGSHGQALSQTTGVPEAGVS